MPTTAFRVGPENLLSRSSVVPRDRPSNKPHLQPYPEASPCVQAGKARFYPRIDPCAIVLVTSPDGERCLLGRAARFAKLGKMGFFTCIAGFIEQAEAVEEAARREVRDVATSKHERPLTVPTPLPLFLRCARRPAWSSRKSSCSGASRGPSAVPAPVSSCSGASRGRHQPRLGGSRRQRNKAPPFPLPSP